MLHPGVRVDDISLKDVAGDNHMDTFQMIAFLLSAFNIASIMVSNANNNNNNNNVNDNSDNINDNNINESNTNAMVTPLVMVGLGGRALNNVTKRSTGTADNWLLNLISHRYNLEKKEKKKKTTGPTNMTREVTSSVEDLLQLVMRAQLSVSFPCLERVFCDSCQAASSHGAAAWALTEVFSLLLSQKALPANRGTPAANRVQQVI